MVPLQAMVASLKRKSGGGGAQQSSGRPAKQPKPAQLNKRKLKPVEA